MHAIDARRLVRKFGDFVAVAGVEFEVRQGEVFGFLGPNGAGKSTTINMLCTMMRPTSGTAVINGHDVVARPDLVRQSIGIIFQDASLDDRLTGLENLRFHAMLYDVPRETFAARSKELLAMVDLTDKAGEQVRTYSGGMKRRLEIARGLLHHPKVLFLDEPTIGLDPQTRRHIWQYPHEAPPAGRRHDVHDDALHGGGRALRSHRRHRPRKDRRARHAGEPEEARRRRHHHGAHVGQRARGREARWPPKAPTRVPARTDS